MKSRRYLTCATFLLGATLLVDMPALARLPIEDAIFKAPMPHEQFRGGDKIKVHYVSRHRLDPIGKGETLKSLRQQVQKCVASTTAGGRKVNPPTTWPEEAMLEMRFDSYYAFNRGITYEHGVQFGVHPVDCSLLEVEVSTAVLQSSYGMCHIDLLNKFYKGECDPKAHERAQVTPLAPTPPPGQQEADLARMKSNPKLAAMAAAMEAAQAVVPKPTGAVKAFDGVKCDVMAVNAPVKGTLCVMRGGSFVPSIQAVETGLPGVLLETNLPKVGVVVTDRVKLDAEVGAAVFTPYLKGFTNRNDEGAE